MQRHNSMGIFKLQRHQSRFPMIVQPIIILMFYVPGEFVYSPSGVSQKVISKFNRMLDQKASLSESSRKATSTRIKTIGTSLQRTKRVGIECKESKRTELPLIGGKMFFLKGSSAQQSPCKKMSLRRLELQNRIILPQGKMEIQKGYAERGSERIKFDSFSLLPWQYGEDSQF